MVIAIGGISRSGKSFLAMSLKEFFIEDGYSVCHLDQDDYVLPEAEIPLIDGHVDWEIPASIDWDRLTKAIDVSSESYNVVLLEGLLIFNQVALLKKYDYTICLTLDYQDFVDRKRIDLRWGKEPDWYIDHIWRSHLKYGQFPTDQQPNLTLKTNTPIASGAIYKAIISTINPTRRIGFK